MADRRMFSKKVIDSDIFLDMPASTQMLYFHLAMRADDDGFLNNPKKIQRMIGASDDDMRLLLAKQFILGFASGVIVIRHWKLHNYLRSDRYKPTIFTAEKKLLDADENGIYNTSSEKLIEESGNENTTPEPSGIPTGIPMVSTGKDSIGKDRLGKDSIEREKPVRHKYGEYKNVLLTDEEVAKLENEYPDYLEKIENLSNYIASTGKAYKSHYATIRNWARKDAEKSTSSYEKLKKWAEEDEYAEE